MEVIDRGKSVQEQKDMESAVVRIHNAIKKDKELDLIKEITSLNNKQRQIVKSKYLAMHKQLLEQRIKDNFSGDFQDCVLALLKQVNEFEAGYINEGIENIGSDEGLIIHLLCSKDAKELKLLKSAYRRVYGRELEVDIKDQEDGDFNDLYYSLATGARAENNGYDLDDVKADVKELIAATSKKQLDQQTIIRILSTRSFPQLSATIALYAEMAKKDIEEEIKRHDNGSFLLACQTIIKCVKNRPAYFAEQIHATLSGLGTKDKHLIRLIISRAEIDMAEIKIEYQRLYKESLYSDIKGDTSGYYEKLLLQLVGKDD